METNIVKQDLGTVNWVGKNLLQENYKHETGDWFEFADEKLDSFGNAYLWRVLRCYESNEPVDSAYRNAEGMITD